MPDRTMRDQSLEGFGMGGLGGGGTYVPKGNIARPRRRKSSVRSNIRNLPGARLKDPVKGGTVPMDAKHAREMSAQNAGIRAANKVSPPMLHGRQVPRSAFEKGYNEAFTKMANVKTPSRYKSPVGNLPSARVATKEGKKIPRTVRKGRDIAAVREGDRLADKAFGDFMKKQGRFPTMSEADRLPEMGFFKGTQNVQKFYDSISPARRASSLRGRYSKGK